METPASMVETIKSRYGLNSPKVLAAMIKVPREEFVLPRDRDSAYADAALAIGSGQTISQPYTVAFMTHLLIGEKQKAISEKIKKGRVLEVGTGSGYQAAVLSHLFREVYTVEIIKRLASGARTKLKNLGYKNVFVREGSGEGGWAEKAPFDAMIVTAGVAAVPRALFEQLKEGGILVAPVGEGTDKEMTKFVKGKRKISRRGYGIFHFVPFISKTENPDF